MLDAAWGMAFRAKMHSIGFALIVEWHMPA